MVDTPDNHQRFLPWEACRNARDIGGYSTSEGGRTGWRRVVRSDSLCSLTPTGRQALEAYGIRTIIDIRSAYELERRPHPYAANVDGGAAPRYENVPARVQPPKEKWLAARLIGTASRERANRLDLELNRLGYARIVSAIANASPGGIVVHCEAGKDRTGLVVALLLSLVGVADDVIAGDYGLSPVMTLSSEAASHEGDQVTVPAQSPNPHRLHAPPGAMLATLDHLRRRYQGARSYLLDAGVSRAEIANLKQRLVE